MPKATKKIRCCLCKTVINDRRHACDAHPVAKGECCPKCDNTIVTPARLQMQGIPAAEAKTIGQNIHRAVKWHQKKMLEVHNNTTTPI